MKKWIIFALAAVVMAACGQGPKAITEGTLRDTIFSVEPRVNVADVDCTRPFQSPLSVRFGGASLGASDGDVGLRFAAVASARRCLGERVALFVPQVGRERQAGEIRGGTAHRRQEDQRQDCRAADRA